MEHYTVLGVRGTATPDEIKSAYRSRARLLHPDLHAAGDPRAAADAQRAFQDVEAAYSVLSNPSRRRAYDEARRPDTSERPRGERSPSAPPAASSARWHTLPGVLSSLLAMLFLLCGAGVTLAGVAMLVLPGPGPVVTAMGAGALWVSRTLWRSGDAAAPEAARPS